MSARQNAKPKNFNDNARADIINKVIMLKKYTFIILFIAFSKTSNLVAQTQMEMNQTGYNDFNKADAELNIIYKKVMKILNEKEKKLMIKAEKDWLIFRDSHCKFEIEQYDGGSIQPLIYSTCLTEQTNSRMEYLKAILIDESR
jgi:uncharacterized protein YecT (DUF1311 family)